MDKIPNGQKTIGAKDHMDKRPEQRPKDERLKDKGPKDKRYKRQKTEWTKIPNGQKT